MEWEHGNEVDEEPSMQDVILRDQLNISYSFISFRMLVTLDEVEAQVGPEEDLDHGVEYFLDLVIRWRESHIQHRGNARVADEK